MSEVSAWLSIKVTDRASSESRLKRASIHISIPKKLVKLATRRNRIKRLMREAFRKQALLDGEKIYQFRVIRSPKDLSLKDTQEAMSQVLQIGQ